MCLFHYHTKHFTSDTAAAAAKSPQSCPTLCDPIDGSPPGSAVPGILQARILEWVAISFSNAGKWKVKVKSFSRVGLLATAWTAAHQAPPSMGFSGKSTAVGCHCLLHSDTSGHQMSGVFPHTTKWFSANQLIFLQHNSDTILLRLRTQSPETVPASDANPKCRLLPVLQCFWSVVMSEVPMTSSLLLLSHFSRVQCCETP